MVAVHCPNADRSSCSMCAIFGPSLVQNASALTLGSGTTSLRMC
jgi:hypothetical protein